MPITVITNTVSYPGKSSGEFRNNNAFAAIKSDGSVVAWGEGSSGNIAAVASQLNGSVKVQQIFSNTIAFAALRQDGSVVTWGDFANGGNSTSVANALNGEIDVSRIYSTKYAFAALRTDGSVVTWGNNSFGADSSAVTSQLNGTIKVQQIFSTESAFAALRADGSVVTWGDYGGNSSTVSTLINGSVDLVKIATTVDAFAALRADGTVVTWGIGGYATSVQQLEQVSNIYSNGEAFAALHSDGSVSTWGLRGGDSSSVSHLLDGTVDVTHIYASYGAFSALRADGSVVTWGSTDYGADSSAISVQINGSIDVVEVFSNDYAFAALREDGSVITWGNAGFGGNSSQVSAQLNGDIRVVDIASSFGAFAALRADGSVVTWGNGFAGGDSSSVAALIQGDIDVIQIFANGSTELGAGAFSALRADGSIVTWGHAYSGGDSSSVASQLTDVVSIANPSTDDVFNSNYSPTGSVTISGTATQGQTLTASNTLADIDGMGTVGYQWKANGNNIANATGSTYTLTQAEVGKTISVVASYTDGSNTVESVSSSATTAVANISDNPTNTAPTLTLANGLIIPVGTSSDSANSVIQQKDGKLVLAGHSFFDNSIVRLNADGSLDTSFSDDGKLTLPVGTGNDSANSVIQQADGKLVLVGEGYNGNNYDYSVIRLTADGRLDNSFGDNGKLILPVGTSGDYAKSVIQQFDGKLVVSGNSSNSDGIYMDNSIVRLNSDGSLDTSFGENGKLILDRIGWTENLIQQADGKLVLAGYTAQGSYIAYSIVRLNADGSLDTSFSDDGKLILGVGSGHDYGYGVIQQADGKLVVAGKSDQDFSIVRLNADGSLDSSFSDDGKLILPVGASDDVLNSLIQQVDGKLVLAGYSYNGRNNDYSIVRLNVDGSLDASFGDDGKLLLDIGMLDDKANSIIQQADGKLVLAGYSDNGRNNDYSIVRLNADGSLDSTFQVSPNAINEPTNPNTTSTAIVLAPYSKINDYELATAGNYAGASLTISRNGGTNSSDVFVNTGTLGVLTQGSYFSVESVTIGRVTTNSNGTLTLTFNSNATQALVDKTLQQITFATRLSDAPPPSIKLDWTFNDGNTGSQGDGGAKSVTTSLIVNITATNDAPLSHNLIPNTSVTANQAFNLALPTGAFTDPDVVDTLTYSLTMTNGTAVPPWLSINSSTGAISGTPESFDIGSLSLRVTATDSSGANVSDDFSLTVAHKNTSPIGTVTITGTATQGQTLTASNTLADADGMGTVGYQWKANGSNITGATGSTYTLTQAEVGKTISVTASYTDGYGAAESMTSSATTAVANINDAPTGSVMITGTATQGQTLTASNTLADIDGMGTVSYQWKANGSDITGATNSTYTLTQAEVGKTISVIASYTDGYSTAESVSSSATNVVANINDAPTGTVTIIGTAIQGQTLTASNTLADIDGLGTVSYQWKANGSNITNATGSTYTLTQAEVGKTISVTASYSDGYGTAESLISSATTAVANINDAPTGTVTITGTATQGQTLTASKTLADADGMGTVGYQWKANGSNITGATGSTYTLTQAEVGKTISVTASYTDGYGTAESLISSATTAVANINDAPTGSVTISGTATQGQTLTASNTLADIDGMGTLSYQWKANGSNITGATNSTYTLTQAEVGKTISVVASYTDGGNTVESITSTVTAAVVGLYTPVTPLAPVKYFVTGSANNFVEFDMDYGSAGLSLAGSQILYTGGSGVESVYVAKAVSIDFTKASGNTDKIYLNASASDYNYSYQGTTLVLTDKHTNAVVKLAAGSSLSNDRIIFKDGSVKSNNLMDALKANTQPSLDTSLFTPNSKASLYTDLGTQAINTIKAFATNAEGATFATTPKAGTNMIVTGGAGVDKVYVSPYASVDATKLSGGTDLVYFTGKLSDYSKSISGTTLQLSRSNGSETESVKVAAGSSLAYDKLVFADGFVKSIDLFNASKNNTAQPTLDTSLVTPGLNPSIQSMLLDGVANLDVRSNVVLTASESVSAVSGKYIRIINDANTSDKAGLYAEAVTNSFSIAVTDSRVSINGNKITINLDRDLDFANNYHIEVDSGAFIGLSSNLGNMAISDATSINFATVTPGTDKLLSSTQGQAQMVQADGTLANSLVWKDIEGWPAGKTGSQATLDMTQGSFGLLTADLMADLSVFIEGSAATNVETGNFNLALQGFGNDDLIYMDDLGRNNENGTQTSEVIFAIQGTNDGTDTNFNFDNAANKDGGNIDLMAQSFATLQEWQAQLQATNAPFIYG